MKKSLALFTAALWPVTAFAQNKAPATPEASPPADAVALPVPAMERVEFQDSDLPSIIEFLKEKNEQLGGNQRDLNIIVSPGLEKMRVPMLSLRNVTVSDVLTIATTALNVQLQPVINPATGETVAWIVKAPAPNQNYDAFAGHLMGGIGFPPGTFPAAADGTVVGAAPGEFIDAPRPAGSESNNPAQAPKSASPDVSQSNPVSSATPKVVELASGGGGLGGLTAAPAAPPGPVAKVFGITPLLHSNRKDPNERRDERSIKFTRLIQSLQNLADDQGRKAEVKAYDEMDILVVKSADPEAIRLITDVIEALKANAASDKTDANQPGNKEPEKERVR